MADLSLIELTNVSKYIGSPWKRAAVLIGVSISLQKGENHAILSLRDGGVPSANTLINMFSGISRPSTGRIVRRGKVSVPLATTTQISPYKTAQELTFFLARLYNADPIAVLEYAADFARLPAKLMNTKLATLTIEERLKLGFAIGFGLPADLYCFEQAIGWGDPSFRERCKAAFDERRASAATLVTTDNVMQVSSLANTGSVLHKGRLYTFENLDQAIEFFNKIKLSHEETSLAHLRTLVRMGEMQWMSQYLDQIGPSGVGLAEKYTILAELALQNRRFEEAIRAARSALSEGASVARLTMIIAKASEASGDYPEAVRQLELVVEEDDRDETAKILLARNLERLGEVGRAGVIWKFVAIHGDSSVARDRAEVCLLKAKDWAEIIHLTEHMLSRDPQNLRALEMRFKALSNRRSWPETISVIKSVADIDLVKAIGLVYQAIQTDDWPVAITLIKGLPLDRLPEIREERLLTLTLILLRRRRQTAFKDGQMMRVAAADEVIATLNNLMLPAAIESPPKTESADAV